MKYALIKNNIEVKKLVEIKEGCTLEQNWQFPETIKIFNEKEEALEELKHYRSDIRKLGEYYNFEEYYVEEVTLDEDGAIYESFDILGFSKNVVNESLLKYIGFEEGDKILKNNGYVQDDAAISDGVTCDYIDDTYYHLCDDDGNELHVLSFVRYVNRNDDPLNDDRSLDFVVDEKWEEVDSATCSLSIPEAKNIEDEYQMDR